MVNKIEVAANIRAAAGHVRKFRDQLTMLYEKRGDQYHMPPHGSGSGSDAYGVPHVLDYAIQSLDEAFQLIGVTACTGELLNSRQQRGLWYQWPGIKADDPAWQETAEDLFVCGRAVKERMTKYCKNTILPDHSLTKVIPVDAERWANETVAKLEGMADTLAAEGDLAQELLALPERWKKAFVAHFPDDITGWAWFKGYVTEVTVQLARVLHPSVRPDCMKLATELRERVRRPEPWGKAANTLVPLVSEALRAVRAAAPVPSKPENEEPVSEVGHSAVLGLPVVGETKPQFRQPVRTAQAAVHMGMRSDELLAMLRAAKKTIGGTQRVPVAELEDIIEMDTTKRGAVLRWFNSDKFDGDGK